MNEPGTFSWSELITPDVPKAAAFYKQVFGWGSRDARRGDAVHRVQARRREHRGRDESADAGHPADVGHLLRGRRHRRDRGEGEVARRRRCIAGPMDIEPGRFAVLADPQGAVFNVIKMNEA